MSFSCSYLEGDFGHCGCCCSNLNETFQIEYSSLVLIPDEPHWDAAPYAEMMGRCLFPLNLYLYPLLAGELEVRTNVAPIPNHKYPSHTPHFVTTRRQQCFQPSSLHPKPVVSAWLVLRLVQARRYRGKDGSNLTFRFQTERRKILAAEGPGGVAE